MLEQLLAAECLPRVRQQEDQQVVLPHREAKRLTTRAGMVRRHVDFDVTALSPAAPAQCWVGGPTVLVMPRRLLAADAAGPSPFDLALDATVDSDPALGPAGLLGLGVADGGLLGIGSPHA